MTREKLTHNDEVYTVLRQLSDRPDNNGFIEVSAKKDREGQAVIANARMRKRRKELGLTAIKLGERVGVSGASIEHYESFRTLPSGEILKKIAQELGIPEDEVFPPWLQVVLTPDENDSSQQIALHEDVYPRTTLVNLQENRLNFGMNRIQLEELAERYELHELMGGILGKLKGDARMVIELVYGFGGHASMRQVEVAREITQIRQIFQKRTIPIVRQVVANHEKRSFKKLLKALRNETRFEGYLLSNDLNFTPHPPRRRKLFIRRQAPILHVQANSKNLSVKTEIKTISFPTAPHIQSARTVTLFGRGKL